jgi:hypothetical protein
VMDVFPVPPFPDITTISFIYYLFNAFKTQAMTILSKKLIIKKFSVWIPKQVQEFVILDLQLSKEIFLNLP